MYCVRLRLRLMLQTRARYTVFVARQIYERNFCDGLEIKFTSPSSEIQQAGAEIFWTMSSSFKQCPTHFSRGGEKFSRVGFVAPPLVTGLHTILHFIVTNFHTKLKPPANVSHGVYSPTFRHLIHRTMGVGRAEVEGGLGPSLHFEIWHFPIKFLAKKVVCLVSSGKNESSPFLAPPRKSLALPGKIYNCLQPG